MKTSPTENDLHKLAIFAVECSKHLQSKSQHKLLCLIKAADWSPVTLDTLTCHLVLPSGGGLGGLGGGPLARRRLRRLRFGFGRLGHGGLLLTQLQLAAELLMLTERVQRESLIIHGIQKKRLPSFPPVLSFPFLSGLP